MSSAMHDLEPEMVEAMYTSLVPLASHADLEPYIQRIADGDDSPLLTTEPITMLSLSSGTTDGRPKYVPFTPFSSQSTLQIFGLAAAYRSSSGTTDGRPKYVPFTPFSSQSTLQIFRLAAAYRSSAQDSESEMGTVFGATPPKGKMMSKASPHYYRLRTMGIRALSVKTCPLELEDIPTMGEGEGGNRGRRGRGRGRGRPPGRGRDGSRGGSARTRAGQRQGRGRGRSDGMYGDDCETLDSEEEGEENESSEETPEPAAVELATREEVKQYKILICGPNNSGEDFPAKYPAFLVYREILNRLDLTETDGYGTIEENDTILKIFFLMQLTDNNPRLRWGNRSHDLKSNIPIDADFLFLIFVHFTYPTVEQAWRWLRAARDCNCKVPKLIGFACTGPRSYQLTKKFIRKGGNCLQLGFQKMIETLEERYIGCFDERPIFINLSRVGNYTRAAKEIIITVREHLGEEEASGEEEAPSESEQ